MADPPIHQLLHGYRKGHQLLEASTRLPPAAADLVAQASDLSGALPTGVTLKPYLTLYPVPDTGYYALARTWPDTKAPRSGCVLTHTLLVPAPLWAAADDPERFTRLHAEPGVTAHCYTAALADSPGLATRPTPPAGGGAFEEFVRKFFGEGIRPIVWAGSDEAERIIWAVVRLAWPALRHRLAADSFSLQRRALPDRPFDLMFAPAEARPRFRSLPSEAVIPAGREGTSDRAEPWLGELSDALLSPAPRSPVQREAEDLGPLLNDDPAAVRNLFTARDLRRRLASSPTAGVGLMDLVEALAPPPEAAAETKAAAAIAAVEAAVKAPPGEALRCLYLVSDRLTRPAFQRAAGSLAAPISAAVRRLAAADLGAAVSALGSCRLVGPLEQFGPYARGLLDGLEDLADRQPEVLRVLSAHAEVGPRVVARRPRVAVGYLRAAAGEATSALVKWVRQADPDERAGLRAELLPELSAREFSLLDELLRDVPADEVPAALDAISRAPQGFSPAEVRQVVADRLSCQHGEPVRQWAARTTNWSIDAAEVVAAAFEPSSSGLGALLVAFPAHSDRRAQVVAAFLKAVIASRRVGWLRDVAAADGTFLIPLLPAGRDLPASLADALGRVLLECPYIPIGRSEQFVARIGQSAGSPDFPLLADRALTSAVTEFVRGNAELALCRRWFIEPWAVDWFGRVPPETLLDLFRSVGPPPERARAWTCLAEMPTGVYQRSSPTLPDLTRVLAARGRCALTADEANAWRSVLCRAAVESSPATQLRLCVDAVAAGFRDPRAPLGGVVAAAFPTVYRAVIHSGASPETDELFGFFDWDRAKELRKKLIESFMASAWRPGDLAIAAGGEPLLRKIVKRLRRKWRGEEYAAAVLEDLQSRSEPEAVEARSVMTKLLSDPEYDEPWD
ncbi:MAG: hypothetical protein U0797_08005 [Gemmataceae bacterium]